MSGFAALSGAADFLGGYASSKIQEGADNKKMALLSQLRKEEEAASAKIAEEKAAKTIEGKPELVKKDGVWHNSYKNSFGDTIKEEVADEGTVSRINREEQKETISLENALLNKRKLEKELSGEKTISDLDRRYKEAQIENLKYKSQPKPDKDAKPAAYTAPTAGSLAAYLGPKPDSEDKKGLEAYTLKTKDFAVFRKAHPEIRSGEEALIAYTNETAERGPRIIDPSLPGSMTIKPPARAVGNAPFADGQKLKGPDGRIYVVRNGKPVLVK